MTETASRWSTVLNRIPITGRDAVLPDKVVSMPPRSLEKMKQDIIDCNSNIVQIQCEADRLVMEHTKATEAFRESYAATERAHREASEALMAAQMRWAEMSRSLGIKSEVLPSPPLPTVAP